MLKNLCAVSELNVRTADSALAEARCGESTPCSAGRERCRDPGFAKSVGRDSAVPSVLDRCTG